jgi:hypothetical protein
MGTTPQTIVILKPFGAWPSKLVRFVLVKKFRPRVETLEPQRHLSINPDGELSQVKYKTREYQLRGSLSTVDLLVKVACFVKRVNNIFK